MGDVSNKTVVALLAVALVITVVGTVVSVSKLSSLGGDQAILSGAASSNGTSTLTIMGTAGISLDDSAIAFGTFQINTSATCSEYGWISSDGGNAYCILNSSGLSSLGEVDDNHVVNNTGSIDANITVKITGDVDAEDVFCNAASDCPGSATSEIDVQASNLESNSCKSGLASTWELLADHNSNSTVVLCDQLGAGDTADTMEIEYNLTVPIDADAGALTLTAEYTATAPG